MISELRAGKSWERIFLSVSVIIFFISLAQPIRVLALTESEQARQAALQEQLKQVEADIAKNSALLSSKQKETASLQRDVDVLTYKIATAKLNIRAKQLEIERLGGDIVKKASTINNLTTQIEREKASLAELLRKTRELDGVSVLEVALAGHTLSETFVDLNSFNFLEAALKESFYSIRTNKKDAEVQKVSLENKKDATEEAKAAIEAENRKVQVLEAEKKSLLNVSKNQESGYKQILAERKKKRAEILSALFALRDSKAIPFEEALKYAKEASNKTGVRAAFILAILTQETNLGQNVGTCNRPGDLPAKSWDKIMKPTRDIAPYLRITKSLGIEPDTMPLSCPQAGGYGGAMGPSQFIPSTWELYIKRITAVTGNNPPNPWNAEDAFAATSLYLKDLGASEGTYAAESRAAGKYYAGSRWATAGKGYSASVMAIATRIQSNIDYLTD